MYLIVHKCAFRISVLVSPDIIRKSIMALCRSSIFPPSSFPQQRSVLIQTDIISTTGVYNAIAQEERGRHLALSLSFPPNRSGSLLFIKSFFCPSNVPMFGPYNISFLLTMHPIEVVSSPPSSPRTQPSKLSLCHQQNKWWGNTLYHWLQWQRPLLGPDALRWRSRTVCVVVFSSLFSLVPVFLGSKRELSLCCHREIWNGGLMVFSLKGAFLFYFEIF